MRKRPCLLVFATTTIVLAAAAPAFGWSNGPNEGAGFGTHDWVLTEARRLAGSPAWLATSTALAATDDPDTVNRDFYYHVYDAWGNRYGGSPHMVAYLYARAVKEYRARRLTAASRYVGLLSHYYADSCDPLHTEDSSAGGSIRYDYEAAVDLKTNAIGKNRSWVKNDRFQRVTDVSKKTKSAAAFAHRYNSSLVSNFSRSGFNSSVVSTTRITLNRAANDLADIIRSIPMAPPVKGMPTIAPPPSCASPTATLAGMVCDSGGPVGGAIVRVQATNHRATTDSHGCFQMRLPPETTGTLSAWASGYFITGGVTYTQGQRGIVIGMRRIRSDDATGYAWLSATATSSAGEGSTCVNCHSIAGTNSAVELPVDQWRRDAHSKSATNPRFLTMYSGTDMAGNQSPPTRYVPTRDYGVIPLPPDTGRPYFGPGYRLDFPTNAGNCAACHVPVAAVDNPFGVDVRIVQGVAKEGVTCDFCHKVWDVRLNPKSKLTYSGLPGVLSFDMRRPSAASQLFTGPLDDVAPGDDTYSPIQRESAYCAPCHRAVFWGTLVYDSYGEWLASPYSDPSTGSTCQECHMPRTGASQFARTDKGGRQRDPATIFSHAMPGAADATLLSNAVSMTVSPSWQGDEIAVQVAVVNDRTGHHVPTDSPLRNVLLVVAVRGADGTALVQTGGPTVPAWGGVGDPVKGYYGGLPGTAYAKVLEELWTRVSPTGAYWKQTRIVSDNRIPAFGRDDTVYRFRTSGTGPARVEVRLLFRRAFRELADQKGWKDEDIVMAEYSATLAR